MSPEQARKSVDRRADIWAFGIVRQRCWPGAQLFQETVPTSSVVAVRSISPDCAISTARVRGMIARCTERDRRRLRALAARVALRSAGVGTRPM